MKNKEERDWPSGLDLVQPFIDWPMEFPASELVLTFNSYAPNLALLSVAHSSLNKNLELEFSHTYIALYEETKFYADYMRICTINFHAFVLKFLVIP